MFKKRTIETVIGKLILVGDTDRVEYIQFGAGKLPKQYEGCSQENDEAFSEAVRQLQEYFAGDRKKFSFPIRLVADGFQQKALAALRTVEYGQTISYKQLANMAGSANAFRAAGTACAGNPLPIVIPCHRVLKSDGRLGGFGGGLKVKKMLLDLEHAQYRE